MPFQPISWWMAAVRARTVVWDVHEHFQKRGRRSHYRIATAEGETRLSIPIVGGRDQRTAMRDVRIDNSQQWARRHLRTIETAYRRAPFFEHFEPSLRTLYKAVPERLADFNRASVAWLRSAFRLDFSEEESMAYEREPSMSLDLRDEALRARETSLIFSSYTQVFADRYSFLPNLSALDLLFSEGPHAVVLLGR